MKTFPIRLCGLLALLLAAKALAAAEIKPTRFDLQPEITIRNHHIIGVSEDGSRFADVDVGMPGLLGYSLGGFDSSDSGTAQITVRSTGDGKILHQFDVPKRTGYLYAGTFTQTNDKLYVASESIQGVWIHLFDFKEKRLRSAATSARLTPKNDQIFRVVETKQGVDLIALRLREIFMRYSIDLNTLEGQEVQFINAHESASDSDSMALRRNVARANAPEIKTTVRGCQLRELYGDYRGLWVAGPDPNQYGRRLSVEPSDYYILPDESKVLVENESGITLYKVTERKEPRLSWTATATPEVIKSFRDAGAPLFAIIAKSQKNPLTDKAIGPIPDSFLGVVQVTVVDDKTYQFNVVTEVINPDSISSGWLRNFCSNPRRDLGAIANQVISFGDVDGEK